MKKNAKILFILLVSISAFSQNKNFSIENNLVVWRLVYEDERDISNLKKQPLLEFKTDSTGSIKRTNFNNKKLHELTGDFIIESKDGKYRVSVFNVRHYTEPIGLYSGGVSMQTTSAYTIEDALIKKGEIRKSKLGFNLTETLNPHLVELFTIKDTVTSDW